MTWATDSVFVAGGDFVDDYWPDFQAQTGVSAVVTIAPDRPRAYGEPRPVAALWLPVADEAAYTLETLSLGTDFIAAALAANRKVLLHGPQGVHRTRPLVAAHLLQQGRSLARVLRELEEKPWLPPYQGDASLLELLAGRLTDRVAAAGQRK
jgi:hypothetical protein